MRTADVQTIEKTLDDISKIKATAVPLSPETESAIDKLVEAADELDLSLQYVESETHDQG